MQEAGARLLDDATERDLRQIIPADNIRSIVRRTLFQTTWTVDDWVRISCHYQLSDNQVRDLVRMAWRWDSIELNNKKSILERFMQLNPQFRVPIPDERQPILSQGASGYSSINNTQGSQDNSRNGNYAPQNGPSQRGRGYGNSYGRSRGNSFRGAGRGRPARGGCFSVETRDITHETVPRETEDPDRCCK